MSNYQVVAQTHDTLGEVPMWDVETQRLWWTDIESKVLRRVDPVTGNVDRWDLPERLGSYALRTGGGLVCAFESGFAFFDPEDGKLEWIAKPEAKMSRNRFNDGKTDRQGRFWAGTMDDHLSERTGALYRLDPDLSVHLMEKEIGISNSLCWSPNNTTFYFADTMVQEIWAYKFDGQTGDISERILFADTHEQPGQPDGSTVDSEGFLWNAQWGGWRLVRYAPDGQIDRIVDLPVQYPTSVIFGGPDLSTLFVTTAVWDLEGPALKEQPCAGAVLSLDVGVKGLPESRFSG